MKQNLPSSAKESNLIGWLEMTRIALPLRTVDYRFSVIDDVADVHLAQVFEQSHSKPLNITYTFPLPAKASVYSCTIKLNEKILEAKIEERQKAVKIAKKKAAKGYTTGLVEMERDNVFTLSLGNAAPKSQIIVTISYVEIIDKVKDMRLFRIPTSVGQRYIPGKPLIRGNYGLGVVDDTDQVPDASRISPPSIDTNHPDAASLYFAGEIVDESMAKDFLSSSSHPVQLTEGKNGISIELLSQKAVPAGDITLRWRQKIVKQEQIIVRGYYDGKDTYALTTIKMPQSRQTKSKTPKDYYFLIDQSGSMQGKKWIKTIDSLMYFIRSVAADDRVWLTFFESAFRDYAEKPITARDLIEEGIFEQMKLEGTLGGTELLPALEHVIEKATLHSNHADAQLILITDGQVGNQKDIVTLFSQKGKWPLHCLGIDEDVNDSLLQELSAMSKGFCALMKPEDDFEAVLGRLSEKFQTPQLEVESFVGSWELPDKQKINLWPGETVCFATQCAGRRMHEISFQTKRNNETCLIESPIQWTKNPLPKLIWAKKRINYLTKIGKPNEVVALSKSSNLLATTTAFVAWDRDAKELVAQDHLYQPVHRDIQYLYPASMAPDPGNVAYYKSYFRPAAAVMPCSFLLDSEGIKASEIKPLVSMSLPEKITVLFNLEDKMRSLSYRSSFRLKLLLHTLESSFMLKKEECDNLWTLCQFFCLSEGETSGIDQLEKAIQESAQIKSLIPLLDLLEKSKHHLPKGVEQDEFDKWIQLVRAQAIKETYRTTIFD